jgi:serine/threonine-protein kinase
MMGDLPPVIGPYRVIRQLGEGGMGVVYEAVHEVIKRRVAIKVLLPEAGRSTDTINRFLNEARAANLVNHPGLVQVTDFGSLPDGSGFLVMEYLAGETLADRLQSSSGKLPPEEAVHIGVQIASALAVAHKKGIIHRDLKPNNAMLVPDSAMANGERVKVLDFGLAKLSEVREAAFVKTNSQAVLGTPLYMSPEQCEGAGHVDAKTDVYALGCMLYEMLAGRPPFLGEGPGQVLGKHMFQNAEPLRKLAAATPEPLAALVDKLLVKSKDERPSMRETQRALEALAAELPPPQRRAAPVEPSGMLPAENLAALGTAATLAPGAAEREASGAKPDLVALGMDSTLGHGAAEKERSGAKPDLAALGMVSTLGHSAAEKERPGSQRPIESSKSINPINKVLAGALAVLILGGGVALFLRQPAPHAPVAPVIQARPVAPKQVTTRVESEPPGAQVLRDADGQVLGRTPWSQQGEAQPGKLELTLRLPGYRDQALSLSLSADDQAHVVLIAQASPARSKKGTRRAAPVSQPASGSSSSLKRLVDKLTGKSTGRPVPIGTSQRAREERR